LREPLLHTRPLGLRTKGAEAGPRALAFPPSLPQKPARMATRDDAPEVRDNLEPRSEAMSRHQTTRHDNARPLRRLYASCDVLAERHGSEGGRCPNRLPRQGRRPAAASSLPLPRRRLSPPDSGLSAPRTPGPGMARTAAGALEVRMHPAVARSAIARAPATWRSEARWGGHGMACGSKPRPGSPTASDEPMREESS
jgi:hypothetical protein